MNSRTQSPVSHSSVTRIPAASSDRALQHFQSLLEFETDCWDVHHAIQNQQQDFVLLDVRNENAYAESHIQNAINIPHQKITEQRLAEFSLETMFVVYCAGQQCNATEQAAIRLAKLGRPVKKMIGGIVGWLDNGFTLETSKSELKTA